MTKNPNKNKQTRLVEIFKIPELVFRESICGMQLILISFISVDLPHFVRRTEAKSKHSKAFSFFL